MLEAVMLVLREVLEAALFISLLLALGRHLGLRTRWERAAIPLGLAASWWIGASAYAVAGAFDGMGQELLNAVLYGIAILCFIVLNTLLVARLFRPGESDDRAAWAFAPLFVLIVAGSMAREGSEVWIYLSGFARDPDALGAAATGGLVGLGIGVSLCVLVYYALAFVAPRRFFAIFLVVATLVVGGLAMQLAKQGLQAGVLESGAPVWDVSAVLSERSWAGQLLHALFGYDANPDTTQALFYAGAMAVLALGATWQLLRREARNHG